MFGLHLLAARITLGDKLLVLAAEPGGGVLGGRPVPLGGHPRPGDDLLGFSRASFTIRHSLSVRASGGAAESVDPLT